MADKIDARQSGDAASHCRYKEYDPEAAASLALSAVKETTNQAKLTTDKLLVDLAAILRDVERRVNTDESDIAVLKEGIGNVKSNTVEQFAAQREAVSLALAAAKETTQIAQATADRAIAKAEAAADKAYLESQIEGLRSSFSAQIIAQKEAINAALVAAKDALTAALTAAEKAIAKAEAAADKRFESVNEFRKTLSDQTATFIQRNEYSVQYNSVADRVTSLESRLDRGEAKTSVSDPAAADAIKELSRMVADLARSRDTGSGAAKGAEDNWKNLIIIGLAVIAAVTLFMKFGGAQ